jgi:L-amino acid N-acyltransferase YncA
VALIRRVRAGDAAAIAAIYRPYVEQSRTSFELTPPDAAEIAARIGRCGDLYPYLVATEEDEEDGAIVGYAYATAFRDRPAYRFSVETSVYLAPAAQGKGLGRALYAPLLDILTAQGFVHAIGAITVPNEPSIGLHRAMGYEDTGLYPDIGYKMGRWATVQLLRKRLCPLPAEPAEPLPLSACPPWAAIPG